MDKLKELLNAYAGLCEFIFGIIPGVKGLPKSVSSLLLALFTWVAIPLLLISVLIVTFKLLKWAFYSFVILLLLLPALYIWVNKMKK